MLESAGLEVTVRPDFNAPSEEELVDLLRQEFFAVITTVEDPVTDTVLEAASGALRIVAQAGVGYDNVNVPAASKRGVWTSNTPGVLTDATADLAFSLLCSAVRQVPQSDRYVREGEWSCWHPSLFLGPELWGATVGVVGFGRIGQAFARRCAGFEMNILYTANHERESGLPRTRYVSLDELLAKSDFVSLHVPLNDSTDRLIGRESLEAMKPTAFLVNTSRGRVVDTDALVEALQAGTIAGAALDVTDPEPLPADHPLLTLGNAVVTPHIGSATHPARRAMAETAARNVIAVADGKRPPNALADV